MDKYVEFIKDLLKSEKERNKELEKALNDEIPTNWENILSLGKPDLTH